MCPADDTVVSHRVATGAEGRLKVRNFPAQRCSYKNNNYVIDDERNFADDWSIKIRAHPKQEFLLSGSVRHIHYERILSRVYTPTSHRQ